MAIIGKDIDFCVKLLRNEEVIAIPTETVYGLAGNIFSSKAIDKIYKIKNRPYYNPLIVHTNSIEKIFELADYIPDKAIKLLKNFSPGPLTVILRKKNIVSDIVTGNKNSVAIRIPNHELTLDLLNKLDFPVAAPSANPFSYVSPTNPNHVNESLGDKIQYILDGGQCQIGIESTVISFVEDIPVILRFGKITKYDIISVIGKVDIFKGISEKPDSPGQLKIHYSPNKKLILGNIEELKENFNKNKIGILSFSKTFEDVPSNHQLVLSKNKDLNEASYNLFNYLRILDNIPDIDIILAERLPNTGIGIAINDRLLRASSKR